MSGPSDPREQRADTLPSKPRPHHDPTVDPPGIRSAEWHSTDDTPGMDLQPYAIGLRAEHRGQLEGRELRSVGGNEVLGPRPPRAVAALGPEILRPEHAWGAAIGERIEPLTARLPPGCRCRLRRSSSPASRSGHRSPPPASRGSRAVPPRNSQGDLLASTPGAGASTRSSVGSSVPVRNPRGNRRVLGP